MQKTLSSRVLATIERYAMACPGERLAVAVSGGGDSVALLGLLEELREACGLTLVVAHFNHRLRGNASDADERFVRELAAARGLECFVASEDVAGQARRAGSNVEEEARKRRYAFFSDLVGDGRASRVATAHTADDQAETVLARLTRGTGIRGLAGIHPVLGSVVRPLLGVRRSELRAYLAGREQPWREDESNLDASRLRTRIRRRLLPMMEAEFRRAVTEKLATLAELARNDEALLEQLVSERFGALIGREGTDVVVEAMDLAGLRRPAWSREAGEALAARLTRRAALETRRELRGLTAKHIARVLRLARQGTSGKFVELPGGVVVERVHNRLRFSVRNQRDRAPAPGPSYAYPANPLAGGEAVVEIAETGKRVRLKLIDWPPPARETGQEGRGALDAGRVQGPLVVRNWLPGDAYRPCGRGHAAKLKRLLLELGIKREDRAGWPVLTAAGRVIWAGGLPVAAEFAAGQETRQAVLVTEEGDEFPEGPGSAAGDEAKASKLAG